MHGFKVGIHEYKQQSKLKLWKIVIYDLRVKSGYNYSVFDHNMQLFSAKKLEKQTVGAHTGAFTVAAKEAVNGDQ